MEYVIEEEKSTEKKRVNIYEEDDETMASCETSDYVVGGVSDDSVEGTDVDHSTLNSARGS